MSDLKAKMHQNRFQLGLGPDPAGGTYSAPPGPLAGFKGPTSKGRGGKEGKGRGPRLALVWGPRMVNPALNVSLQKFAFSGVIQ